MRRIEQLRGKVRHLIGVRVFVAEPGSELLDGQAGGGRKRHERSLDGGQPAIPASLSMKINSHIVTIVAGLADNREETPEKSPNRNGSGTQNPHGEGHALD